VACETCSDLRVGVGPIFDPFRIRREFGIFPQPGLAQHFLCQYAPFAIVLNGNQNIGAISALEHAVRRDRCMGQTDALEGQTPFTMQQRDRHPFSHGIEHGHGYLSALVRLSPHDQRFENGLVSIEACGNVDNRHANAGGRIRSASHRRDAGFGLDQKIVSLALGIWPALAVTRNRTANEPRVLLPQPTRREAELGDRARLEVLHEHIGLGQHGFEQCLVIRLGKIEHNRLLATIKPDEIGAFAMDDVVVIAREITFRAFDLDHARARIGETAGTLRCRHRLLDRNDEKS
jgi:hypothetical protein